MFTLEKGFIMNKTFHAKKRIQQRGVAPFILDLLTDFGARVPAGDGAEICYFDRNLKN